MIPASTTSRGGGIGRAPLGTPCGWVGHRAKGKGIRETESREMAAQGRIWGAFQSEIVAALPATLPASRREISACQGERERPRRKSGRSPWGLADRWGNLQLRRPLPMPLRSSSMVNPCIGDTWAKWGVDVRYSKRPHPFSAASIWGCLE